MRKNMMTAIIAAALGAAGSALLTAPLARATAATPSAVAPRNLADDNQKRAAEIPNLRKIREDLLDISKRLKNDVVDPYGYRHESIDHVDQAVGLISKEIDEYKGDVGK